MSNLLAARLQMAMSLGFHILFAVIGIGLPLLMVIAEGLWLRTREETYKTLAQRWARGSAILFAVGAVSGTVLSFELGLLWPRFMEVAGPVVGTGFALEGFAFFTEAIFLGIYVYGWDRVPPVAHWFAGIVIAVSGALSGVLVVAVNAWMNTPAGFALDRNGMAVDIDPLAALLNLATASEAIHMTLAAYVATGFLVAGVHAYYLLREPTVAFQRRALKIALVVGGIAALLQGVSGDFSAKQVARTQPVKLAAMEGQFRTEQGAPLRIGGLPDSRAEVTRYAIEVPGMLSWLAYGRTDATVRGLSDFPRNERPPVAIVHLSFQVMVACGSALVVAALSGAWHAFRKKPIAESPVYLRVLVCCAPLGMLAVLAGWTVTEVGRQPWIIRGTMRTAEAVTPVSGLWISLVTYTALYLILGIVVVAMMRMQFRAGDVGQPPEAH